MKTNAELQKDVQDAIQYEPLLKAAEIGVTAKDGIVTLTGTVNSYAKKTEAENAAKGVKGVKAVVEKIELTFGRDWTQRDDNEIAIEAVTALKWNWRVPADKVKVQVENGWVTLDGELSWHYQKEAAEDSIKRLLDVTGLTNKITIKSEIHDQIEAADIVRALERNWSIHNEDITVSVSKNCVTLTGIVTSTYEKDEASRIAWKAPGVCALKNNLVVEQAE